MTLERSKIFRGGAREKPIFGELNKHVNIMFLHRYSEKYVLQFLLFDCYCDT